MNWVTTEELKSKLSVSSRSHIPSDCVLFATDKKGKTTGGFEYSMRIGIPIAIATAARILPDDRVSVAFDMPRSLGLIRRVIKGGRKLCKNHTRYVIKEVYVPGIPTVCESVGCKSWTTEEGIVFQLPPNTNWAGNARESVE
jgi:hypothetical protein